VNGTLVRILTEDGMEQIFRAAAHFLTYQGTPTLTHRRQRSGGQDTVAALPPSGDHGDGFALSQAAARRADARDSHAS
jgi:hypothetical protein